MNKATKRVGSLCSLLATGLLLAPSACSVRASQSSAAAAAEKLQIAQPALFPESIAYDARADRFLVGSFRDGGLYEVSRGGALHRLVDDARLSSVLGVCVDSARGRVVVANGDLGAALRPSARGPKTLAGVASYDLATGAALFYAEPGLLQPDKKHLANGIAVDDAGNAYVTDSLSATIFKVDLRGEAAVFLQAPAFEGEGITLNGVVTHPDGYLLVAKKSDGRLFRVPLANPTAFDEVELPRPVKAADGLVLLSPTELGIIANETVDAKANEVVLLKSGNGWRSAELLAVRRFAPVYPTAGVMADGTLYVLHTGLNQLIAPSAEGRERLGNRATIESVGGGAPFRVFP